MREVTFSEYERFRSQSDQVRIAGKPIRLEGHKIVKDVHPPEYEVQETTIWSFPDRGSWATHKGDYKGNCSPWVVRNVLELYSKPGDTVLDQMVGGGTTLVECKLMGRNGIGVDVSLDAVMLSHDRLNFSVERVSRDERVLATDSIEQLVIKLFLGDARRLDAVESDSIDVIMTHPPYANIVSYTEGLEGDVSQVRSFDEFFQQLVPIAQESFRVLKPGGYAAILIGDTHKHSHFVPLSFRTLAIFSQAGFVLKEDVIKRQWRTETMRGKWRGGQKGFLLTHHEHLLVLRKLAVGERPSKFKSSKVT